MEPVAELHVRALESLQDCSSLRSDRNTELWPALGEARDADDVARDKSGVKTAES